MSRNNKNSSLSDKLKEYQTSGSYYRRIQSNLNSVLSPEESTNKRRRIELPNDNASQNKGETDKRIERIITSQNELNAKVDDLAAKMDGIGGVLATFEAKFSKLVELLQENQTEINSTLRDNNHKSPSPNYLADDSTCSGSIEFVEMVDESIPGDPQFDKILPIDSEKELDNLENMLRDKQIFDSFVNEMSCICGRDGKMPMHKVFYIVIDRFLTRAFVNKCSWTGSSKSKIQKVALIKYIRFVSAVYHVIKLACSNYSELNNKHYFLGILKNSSARLAHKTYRKREMQTDNDDISIKHELDNDAEDDDNSI